MPSPNKADLRIARDFARRLKEVLGENIVKLVLYGSIARGDSREGSDFDVIVVVERKNEQVREAVLDVYEQMMSEYEELFATVIMDRGEWAEESRLPLGWAVEEDGVEL